VLKMETRVPSPVQPVRPLVECLPRFTVTLGVIKIVITLSWALSHAGARRLSAPATHQRDRLPGGPLIGSSLAYAGERAH
jgi:hypothetical protein